MQRVRGLAAVLAARRGTPPRGAEGMRPSATHENSAACGQLVGNWTRMRATCSITRAPTLIRRSRGVATVLLGAFSRREMVDCDASGAPACRTAADCDLHQRIVPRPVDADGVLVAARHHHLEHRVPDALRIAPIRHRCRKPPAHPELAHRRSQQQQTAIRRLIAASNNCEFLAPNRWKVEGKQRIVAHGACDGGLFTAVAQFLTVMHNPG